MLMQLTHFIVGFKKPRIFKKMAQPNSFGRFYWDLGFIGLIVDFVGQALLDAVR